MSAHALQNLSNEFRYNKKCEVLRYSIRVVSGLPGAFYSVCCSEVATILEFEMIEIAWPT